MDKTVFNKELVFLILQFLDEEGLKETAHKLERESSFYFDMKYFEEMVLAGRWDDAESYLSGFTRIDDNRHSTKLYFEIRKQKFLEALDINDRAKALDILIKDLKVFSANHEELFNEMTQLLTINNIREHASLATYRDANSVRKIVVDDIKKVIETNPVLNGKLEFPTFKSQRLRHLLNQSLNWQHLLCKDPLPVPDIQTLLVDHVCKPCLNISSPQSEQRNSIEKSEPDNHLSNCNSNLSAITDSVPFPAAQTNPETTMEDPNVIPFKGRPSQASNEVMSAIANDLPENVVQILKEDSLPTTMDFHPIWHTVLLVGTNIGNVGLWDINSGEKLFSKSYSICGIGAPTINFKEALEKDLCVSVKKITWSPDGSLFGVAFSENFVQLYSYNGSNDIRLHLEIDAHDGSVNDLAFSSPNQQLLVITCGDDKTIKAWDAVNGVECYAFEGHDAPVCSICPHAKQHIHFIFSTSIDGKIKAWLYDSLGARVDFDAPGYGYTTLAYSADDQRLFSCGSGKDGEPYLVEWNESEGYIKRMYKGLKKPCFSTIQFDSTQKGLLAAGDDHMVKFWDMDNIELLTSADVDGELLENPCIQFNKEGTLLAVTAKENKIKVLAINDDIFLKRNKIHSVHDPSNLHETFTHTQSPILIDASTTVADGDILKNGRQKGLEHGCFNSIKESRYTSKFWYGYEIFDPSQCTFLQLPVHPKISKIVRLSYTNAGDGILALASNGCHLLWKWTHEHDNLEGKATTQVSPHIWKSRSGLQFMSNKLPSANSEDIVSCFALSKNDSYLTSTSGGTISLFNLWTFKTMLTIMPSSPMATCLAFYPHDNNILAVGMDNSSIIIYNVRANKIKSKLEGHSKRVTALAFSSSLNLLVSGDIYAHIFVWNTIEWEKQKDMHLQIHGQKVPDVPTETRIQFHRDQRHFLVVLNTHLAIYEAPELRCVNQWVPKVSAVISQATFSSDGQTVYASFVDGTVAIFDALNFQMHSRINPSAYLSSTPSSSIYPLDIAAHPKKPTQFAVGLTDGRVFVFEPQKQGGDWRSFTLDDVRSQQTHANSELM